ncbi:unnamed protein product, partial [Heterotrigona itama]
NAVANDYATENRNGKLDPSIERIFRGSGEQRSNVGSETSKSVHHEDADKRLVRMKRDKVQSGSSRSLNEERSISDKRGKSSSRISRYSKAALPKLPDKDHEVDQEKFEYTDEAEDDASRNKETRYKSNDLRANEDSAGFIDQEERSNLYDDFESKDVVKRGASGAEDYEEVDDDAVGAAEDTAALRRNSLIQDEETEKREVHSDVRVKREHENTKGESENSEEKSGNPGASGDSSSDRKTAETSSKRDTVSDNKAAEATASEAGKDSNDQSKKNVAEKSENCGQGSGSNNEKLIGETVKLQNEQRLNSGIVTDARTGNQGTDLLSGKVAESKVADVANNAAGEGYQRRVEEQIQRKIDSIKEQIKREIEESQRLREIEENNARFDELRELQEGEASLAGEDASDKSQTNSDNTVKRSTKRSKRQDNAVQESETSSKKSRRGTTMRKRSTTKKEKFKKTMVCFLDRQSNEDEKVVAEEDSSSGKKSASVALLRQSDEELAPLATEYGEAFGGLNGDPGMELARFKRIKRVLRSSTSKI